MTLFESLAALLDGADSEGRKRGLGVMVMLDKAHPFILLQNSVFH